MTTWLGAELNGAAAHVHERTCLEASWSKVCGLAVQPLAQEQESPG